MMIDYEHAQEIRNDVYELTAFMRRPHVLMRPAVYRDGDMWCCLYGKNIMEGVCGFGATPTLACEDFDKSWWNGDDKPAVKRAKGNAQGTT